LIFNYPRKSLITIIALDMTSKLLSCLITNCFLLLSFTVTARQTETVNDTIKKSVLHGSVLDQQGRPMPFCSVALFSHSDSAKIVRNTTTDTAGRYSFSNLQPGNYFIRTSALGYTGATSGAILLSHGADVNTDQLIMKTSSTTLNTVDIAGRKAVIENKGDRFVVNTEQSAMAGGNSADLLKSTPFVSITASNEIRLQGKKTMFLIDNKPVPEASVQEMLQMVPAGNISSIELITNPSSRYDAAYGAVINIITKKKQVQGITGNLRADGAQGKYGQYNFNGRLTYTKNKVAIFGMAGYTRSDQQSFNGMDRIFNTTEKPDLLKEEITRTFHQNFYNLQAGMDINIAANQTIGMLATGRIIRSEGDFISDNRFSKLNNSTDSVLLTNSPFTNKGSIYNFNLNYNLRSDSGRNELTILATYTPYKSDFSQTFPSTVSGPDGNIIRTPATYRNINNTDIDIYIAQLDYTHLFQHDWRLETGLKLQNTDSRNKILYEDNRNGYFSEVPEYSSDNHLIETIAGGYAILSKDWKADRIQAGLRIENTDAEYVGNFKQHYMKLFPTFTYEHTISDKYNVSLSYKKTIDRAPYNELVPYTIFINQNTVFIGNPALTPQYDNTITLATKLDQLNISLVYTLRKGMFGQFPIRQDYQAKTTYFALQNLDDAQDFHIDVFYPLQITKWWSTQNSGSVFGYSKATGNVLGKTFSLSSSWYDLKTDHTFEISKKVKLQVVGYYTSDLTSELTRLGSVGNIDASMLVSIFKEKGQLRIGGSDILKRNNYRSEQTFDVYRSYKNRYLDSRRLSIGFTYKFGTSKMMTPDTKLGNRDALNRIQ